MTASSRPNLGGLFNGSVPPERSSRVNGASKPNLSVATPFAAPSDGLSTAPASPPTEQPAESAPTGWAAPQWLDPVRAVEQYFAVLRALLDVNRDVAVACTKAVLSLPLRVGLRR